MKTQLLVDLGNSRFKWALAASGTLQAPGAFAHAAVSSLTPDLDREWKNLPPIDAIFVASVAPLALDVEVEAFARQRFGIVPDFVRSPACALGIRSAYAEPQRFGVDRFLGLAAIHAQAARAQVLVGVGTAMTLDALDADGTHLGGWILPSPALMRASVLARTARVDVADGVLADFATNTADALHSGSLHAASGAVERFVANAARELGTWPEVVLTGGGAVELAPLLPGAALRDDLVLEGLALWAKAAQAPEFARVSQ
ncbi:MAG: type III pantothenate kinase [Rhodanobacteraceae bacterium]